MKNTRIAFIGLGKLGMPVAVSLARNPSFSVTGFDVNPNLMSKEGYPHRETGPYKTDSFQEWLKRSPLQFGMSIPDTIEGAEFIFAAIQTPHHPLYEGATPLPAERVDFDYTYLKHCAEVIAGCAQPNQTLIIISTVLPGTLRREILPILDGKCHVVYNPFFIAMGTVMYDFANPEFVLLGGDDQSALTAVENLYREFYAHLNRPTPIQRMSLESAELTKVAYNTFISSKIAFANTLMEICHKVGANVDSVTRALSTATDRLISPKYLTAGMGDGGGCFPPDEIVFTENGPVAISLIEPGTRVLTADGTLQKVVKVYKRPFTGTLIGVKATGLPVTWMTPEHPVMAAVDCRAKVPDGRYNTSTSILEKMDDAREIRANQLTKDHMLGWPTVVDVAEPPPDYATSEYLELAGWYLAEGSMELSARRGRLRFDLNADELEHAHRISELCLLLAPPRSSLRGASAKTTVKVEGSKCCTRFGCKPLCNWLHLDFGSGAFSKRLPAWLLWGRAELAQKVLRGLLLGDGHFNSDGVAYSTISPKLAWGTFLLLHRLDIPATLRSIPPRLGKDGTRHQRSYEVRVRHAQDAQKLCELTGIPINQFKNSTFSHFELHARTETMTWRKIRKTLSRTYTGNVYNLWVEKNHTYLVAAGAVHNCHPRDNIAMSHLARKLQLSYDLFECLMLARQQQAFWLTDLMCEHDMPKAVFGLSFKPETNITTGSPSLLCLELLNQRGVSCACFDPFIEDFSATEPDEALPAKPHVILIGTKHRFFAEHPELYPAGSVVIDPHRYIPNMEGINVIWVGGRDAQR